MRVIFDGGYHEGECEMPDDWSPPQEFAFPWVMGGMSLKTLKKLPDRRDVYSLMCSTDEMAEYVFNRREEKAP